MTTAAEVLDRLNEKLTELALDAGHSSIEALANYGDRESYCEAIRKAAGYKAVQAIRDELAEDIEEEEPKPRRRTRRKAG